MNTAEVFSSVGEEKALEVLEKYGLSTDIQTHDDWILNISEARQIFSIVQGKLLSAQCNMAQGIIVKSYEEDTKRFKDLNTEYFVLFAYVKHLREHNPVSPAA